MDTLCIECEEASTDLRPARGGGGVCPACAAVFYVECGACHELFPRDESKEADGVAYCVGCYGDAFGPAGSMSEEDVEVLVAEYARVDAEQKKLDARLKELKEMIKAVAATRERVANAVVLGTGESRVTCSFSVSYKCDDDQAAALETVLGAERFSALFKRSITVIKPGVDKLLKGDEDPEIVDAVRGVLDTVETPRITVTKPRKAKEPGA